MPDTLSFPDDETPLNDGTIADTQPHVIDNVPLMMQALGSEQAGIEAAVSEYTSDKIAAIDTMLADITTEASVMAAQQSSQLDPHGQAVVSRVVKLLDSTDKALEAQYADLFVNGVNTPVTMDDYADDLLDSSGSRMRARFNDGSLKSDPRMDDRGEQFAIPGDNAPCPPGYVGESDGYLTRCTWNGANLPPLDTPEEVPPESPSMPSVPQSSAVPRGTPMQPVQPTVPPLVPPTTPTVPPIDPYSGCDESSIPTVIVKCITLPAPPVVYKWWVSVDCSDCKQPKVCVHKGVRPPTVFTGILLPNVYTTEPTQNDLEYLARQCASGFGGPPVSPPPSPPGSPPVTPLPPSPPVPASGSAIGESPIKFADVSAYKAVCKITESITSTTGDDLSGSWNDPSRCTSWHDRLVKTYDTPLDVSTRTGEGRSINQWIYDGLNVAGVPFPDTLMSLVTDAKLDPQNRISSAATLAAKVFDTSMQLTGKVLDEITAGALENSTAAIQIGGVLASANRMQLITGMPLDYLTEPLTQLFHYANPLFIPGQSDFDNLWLSNCINEDQWTCYTRAQGNIVSLHSLVRDSKAVRPGVNEVIELYNRGLIKSESELHARMRENGVIDRSFQDEYWKLSQQTLQISDMIPMMTRDAFDKNVVDKYGLDDEFTDKYPGTAKQYGRAIGVSDEIMRLHWRIHWRVPSDTALYTMIHQLNPNRPEVAEWEAANALMLPAQQELNAITRPETFTVDDLTYALKVNDNLPKFVNKLVAIQYRPITNTDASRMYELGVMDANGMKWAFVKNGYREADSDQLVKFYETQRTKRLSNDTGVFTGRRIISAYKDGWLTENEATSLLAEKIADPATVDSTLVRALQERDIDHNRAMVKAYKRKFMLFQVDRDYILREFDSLGMDDDAALSQADKWQAERDGKAKEPRVAQLCKWFTMGIIDVETYYARLQSMGYSEDDTYNIIKVCSTDEQLKRVKAAAAAADKQRRDNEHAARELKRNLATTIKEMQDRIKMLQEQEAALLASLA